MKTQLETMAVLTENKQQMVDVTPQVRELIAASGIRNGFAGIFSQHTTAGLMVNEWQSALLDDIGEFLGRVVEEGTALQAQLSAVFGLYAPECNVASAERLVQ